MFAEEFLAVYDVSDEVATVVVADSPVVWEELLGADLIEVGKRTPLAGLLGALGVLPELVGHLLHGERPPHGPASLRLREITDLPPERGGWVLPGERPGEELALGLAGRFWRPVIEYADVPAERFRDFGWPGWRRSPARRRAQPAVRADAHRDHR
jgi:hypothetical protein